MATSAKKDEILERRSEVWDLRVKGRTVREISAMLGVSVGTVQSDLDAVRKELDADNSVRAEIERAVGASRLDAAALKLLSIINAEPDIETAGIEALASMANAIPSAINALARIEERRAKLLGLDRPYETVVHTTTASPEEARRLMAEKFGRTARQSTDSTDTDQDEPTNEQSQAI